MPNIAPNAAVPMEPPISRNMLAEAVPTPSMCRGTAFCMAATPIENTGPSPRPTQIIETATNQRGEPSSAIRMGDYKLINFFKDNRLELYNLKDDISETHNLAEGLPELRDTMLGMLYGWWDEVDARFPRGFQRLPNIPTKLVR